MTAAKATFSPPDISKAIILLKAKPDYIPGSASWAVVRELENKNQEVNAVKQLLAEWLIVGLSDDRAQFITAAFDNWVKSGTLPTNNK